MKVIIITGSIATGKSAVSNYLKELNYPVIDADQIAYDIVQPQQSGFEAIVSTFGPQILTEDGEIDRLLLGELIFNDDNHRQRLNALTHPIIFDEIHQQIQHYEHAESPVVFVDIPLFYETDFEHQLPIDDVWVVYVDQITQLNRLRSRDQIDVQAARQKIDSQISIEEKRQLADVVIDNRDKIEQTYQQVDRLLEEII